MRKVSKNPRSKLIKKCDVIFSKIIRKRDKICRKCRKTESTQCAHIFSRSNMATRFNPTNALGLCFYCHLMWAHRNPVEFTLWAKRELGQKNWEKIERLSNTIKQWTPKELQGLYDNLKLQI